MALNPNDTSITDQDRLQRRLNEAQQIRGKRSSGGATGAEGKEGKSSGFRYKFNTGTTEVDPGSGKIALNSSTPSTAVLFRISETDANGNSLSSLLATWDDSTNTVRGQIIVKSLATLTDLLVFNVTGALTDKGTWDQIVVTNVTATGTFSSEEEVLVEFVRAGDKGAEGAEGKTGSSGPEGPAGAATMNGFKEPCRAATTANVTISTALNPGDTIDGVALAENDRVLVKNQTTTKENGIWIVKASPVRATDADGAGELRGGTTVYVEQGTINADRWYSIITNGSITPGTTSHEWEAPPREVYGAVSSAGAKVNGSAGWTVSKPSTGRYNIELSPEATINPPAVTVVTGPSTSGITVWTLREASTTLIQIQIWNFSGGVAVDYPFTFNAKID